MFYVFHQNNSWGKYLPPAREIAVEADDEAAAHEQYLKIDGVYLSDKSDKECICCGPRWTRLCFEYDDVEFEDYVQNYDDVMGWLSPHIPMLVVYYKDGSVKIVDKDRGQDKTMAAQGPKGMEAPEAPGEEP